MINLFLLIFVLISSNCYAAAPVRQSSYATNTTILSSDVTNNENVIFNYLQAGVDTYADGSIVNADIASSANIQSDKLNLASIGQSMAMSSSPFIFAKGADIASAAALTLGTDGNYFDITGTTGITSITAKSAGFVAILQFDGVLTITDGSNLKLAGNFTTSADDTLILICDGTNWHELSRSSN